MERRLIEPVERWMLDWSVLALLVALAWRISAGLLLWGGLKLNPPSLGLIDSQLIAVLFLAALLSLARSLVPRDYSAAAGLLLGLAAWCLALELLPRHGLFFQWPLGRLAPGWLVAGGIALAAATLLQTGLGIHWRRQLGGHGIEWTKRWAETRPLTARKLALKALRFRGDWETQ